MASDHLVFQIPDDVFRGESTAFRGNLAENDLVQRSPSSRICAESPYRARPGVRGFLPRGTVLAMRGSALCPMDIRYLRGVGP